MLRPPKGAKGFTLMELLVVVGILALLASIVAPAVSGTKGASRDGQVKSDAKAAQTAVDNINNKAIDSKFPDTDLTTNHRYTSAFNSGAGLGLAVTLLDSRGIQIGTLASTVKERRTGIKVLERTVLNFDAETDVYQADGSIGAASFVPDFLQKEPDSLKLVADDTRKLDDNIFKEYLWLLKRTSPGTEQENRTVEVFRLVEAACYSGGALGQDGSPQAGSVRAIAEAAFSAKNAAVKTAGSGLDAKNIALKAARKDRDDKQAALDTAVRTFNRLKAAGLSTGAVRTNSPPAASNATGQQKVNDDSEAALATAKTALMTAITDQGVAQSAFDTAVGALTTEQEAQTVIAKNAGAKCEGSNRAVSLKYQLVFGGNQAAVVKEGATPAAAPTAPPTATATPTPTPTPIPTATPAPTPSPSAVVPLSNTGDLYVLDQGSKNILRITPTGAVSIAVSQAQIVAATGAASVGFINRGIAFDGAGSLYFTESVSGSILRRAAGGTIAVLTPKAAIASAAGGAGDPKAIAFGSDGILYVNDDSADSVLQVNSVSGAVSVYASKANLQAATGLGSVNLAGGIVGDGSGNIYTVSAPATGTQSVLKIVSGGAPSLLASGTPFSNLDVFITRAANGDLVVADDFGADTLHRVTSTGVVSTFLSKSALELVTGAAVDLEGGIAFDSSGNFYLAEANSDNILRFDAALTGTVWLSAANVQAVTGVAPSLEGGIAFAPAP